MTAQKVNVFLVNEQKEKQYHAKTVRGLNTKHILCHWSFHKHTHKQDVFVCLVLSDFTPLPSSSVREARYRMETQTRNQKHLPERITLHHRVKLRRSRKHTRTHASTRSHRKRVRSSDLDFRLYHYKLVGRYPSILWSITCALQLHQSREGKSRMWHPHLITVATQKDQFPAGEVLANGAAAASHREKEAIRRLSVTSTSPRPAY